MFTTIAEPLLPSRQVEGFHVALSSHGPVLPVAERIRAVYQCGGTLSVEREDVFEVQSRWVYRVSLSVNERSLIGDAEILLSTDPPCPGGSTPLFSAQVAAVGRALEFAGFGDPKSVFTRLGVSADLSLLETSGAHREARRVIGGVTMLLLDGAPYIPVAERLFHLYQTGISFSMERCEILELAGRGVYRAIVQVGGQRLSGDAEILWQAPAGTPDATHPISCAQLVAVGNALALAGFGEVRGILQRQGKAIPALDVPPQLASAELAQRARQLHRHPPDGTPAGVLAPVIGEQRQQIIALCDRLGRAYPDWSQLNSALAEALLVSLRAEEEEMQQAADAARQTPAASGERSAAVAEPLVEAARVRELKHRWRTLVQPTGDTAAQQAQWKAFKAQVCGHEVSDAEIREGPYAQLIQALDHLPPPAAPSPTPSPASRQSSSLPIRQAPRLASSTNH